MIVEYETPEKEIRRQLLESGITGHGRRLRANFRNLNAKVNFDNFCAQLESSKPGESLEFIEQWLEAIQDSAAHMRQGCAIVRSVHDRRKCLHR